MQTHISPIECVLSFDGGTVGLTATKVPTVDAPYRRALQINNCDASNAATELYVGYDNSVSATRHIVRIVSGGPPVEIAAGPHVSIYIVGSSASVSYAFAEVS